MHLRNAAAAIIQPFLIADSVLGTLRQWNPDNVVLAATDAGRRGARPPACGGIAMCRCQGDIFEGFILIAEDDGDEEIKNYYYRDRNTTTRGASLKSHLYCIIAMFINNSRHMPFFRHLRLTHTTLPVRFRKVEGRSTLVGHAPAEQWRGEARLAETHRRVTP
ncbi:hypothetical protein EVAR_37363_1 [Eumeta japonica]|uniref:Uncharacterized protein n=1 Tax=Eumeta variegata TaxID=151549 RepID=A0A4C1WXU5_EUMVA|nr:hypothetical protein EVAR_37363_1 [Eumeta japonica]